MRHAFNILDNGMTSLARKAAEACHTAARWATAALLSTAMVAMPAHAATTTYFHNDISGSPMVATDAVGAVVWKENYQPYGEKLNAQPASANNKIGFAGRPFDANTGLSYMEARYYDPVLGRFTGIDPAEVAPESLHSFNRYTYANNNPYKYVDPDGNSPLDVAFLVWDLGKLGVAIYQGDKRAIKEAGIDVAMSVVGVVVPVPGAGQAMKVARAAERGVEVVRSAEVAAAPLLARETVGGLRAAGKKDAHHVIQDAAVRDLPGYKTNAAPGIQLSEAEHKIANGIQRQAGGGNYAAERRIGYKALRRAGVDKAQSRDAIQHADDYFKGIGVDPSTPTRIPGNRR